jgi:hypothetical protein
MKIFRWVLISFCTLSLVLFSCQTEKRRSSDQVLNEPLFRYQDIETRWTNFYRSDDWCSTAYFYLDKPVSQFPVLAKTDLRIWSLE